MDEIPRTYEPDFAHYLIIRGMKTNFDNCLSPQAEKRLTNCQRNQDLVYAIMDPCRGFRWWIKLPDLGADSKGYPSIPQGPSVGQELGKLAGMFLGQFIANRFGT